MFMEDLTPTGDMLSSGTATMDLTKLGGLTKKLVSLESNHSVTTLSSKSRVVCQEPELSSGEKILEDNNTCSEFKTTPHMMSSNGSSLTEELDPSELLPRETGLSPIDKEEDSRSMSMPLSEDGLENLTKSFPTSQDQEET